MSLSSYSNEVSFFVKQPKVIDGGESYIVSVTIQKQSISGISKFEVNLPEGFAIRAIETSGSRFIKKDNVGKFIWLSLPTSEDVTISYQIYVPLNAIKEYRTTSTFFYISNKKKNVSTYSAYYEVDLKNTNLTLLELSELLDKYNNHDVYFKVQLGAYDYPLNKDLNSYFKLKGEIREDFSDGFYKYSVGAFKDYFDAKDYQEKCGIDGAFLVLYFVDMKISKQDALKIIEY